MSIFHSNRRTTAGLPLGWSVGHRGPGIGFQNGPAFPAEKQPIFLEGDSHLLTVAPTGAGKGRSAVIPALLCHPGPVLVVDVNGENYNVTARHRRQLGHRVVPLDFGRVAVERSDSFNPFDLFRLPGSEADAESELLAELVTGGQVFSDKDRFWDLTGKGLLTGLIGLAAEAEDPAQRTIGTMLDHLYGDDVDYKIACTLDNHKFSNQLAHQELSAYLSHEGDKCRPSVRSTAQAMVKCLNSKAVRRALGPSTFDLADWVKGEMLDIYLIVPPDKLESHRNLLRLWLGTLLAALLRRRQMPAERTLLLIDEAAQLGAMPHLRTALTLARGYGVTIWTMWQDLSQLRLNYPQDWETILNNSGVVQAFGPNNGWVAKTAAEVLGVPVGELLSLPRDRQILLRPGHVPTNCRRIDYLADEMFRGRFDTNPRYARRIDR